MHAWVGGAKAMVGVLFGLITALMTNWFGCCPANVGVQLGHA